jgi:maltooligosyltrehalose trehalohydrolase
MDAPPLRKFPIGAEVVKGGVNFRVYAPLCKKVEVCSEDRSYPLQAEGNGYYSGTFSTFKNNSLYRFRLDSQTELYADPASRYQPQGPFGASQVVDPALYRWNDSFWKGIQIEGQIIYEMHIGTFTPEGTLAAAQQQLKELAELGITVIELMPLNEFAGQFGWGYDGVNLFAPSRLYGTPDELRTFIDKAHELKIAVIIDVVYNHFGAEGNFHEKFSNEYVCDTTNDWGKVIAFDNESTREFFITNARLWIEEFHFDGLRVDATQNIVCNTPIHILSEISKAAREAAGERQVIIIGENESQESILLYPRDQGGYGFDSLWNDDFHHTARVRLTGRREAYYSDYKGTPQELISALKYGFLFQGQYYIWQKNARGSPSINLPHSSFVNYLQNHDQIANSGQGLRIHQLTDPGNLRAMTALLLLGPNVPLLFQGQEFASSAPFYYFSDHHAPLEKLVNEGRKKLLSQFPSLATSELQEALPNPADLSTFTQCKLNFQERVLHQSTYQLYKDLIKIRKTDEVLSRSNVRIDGAVLTNDAFLIRFFDHEDNDRLLIINLGIDVELVPAPEPLLAPPLNKNWEIFWSSESVIYSGHGSPPLTEKTWKITAHSALLLKARQKYDKS